MLLPKHTRKIKNGENHKGKETPTDKKTETAGTGATKSARTAFQERINWYSQGLPYNPDEPIECTPEQDAKIAARVATISKKLDKRFEKIRRAEKGEFYK